MSRFIPSLDRYARMVLRVAGTSRAYVTVADRDSLRLPGLAGDIDPLVRSVPITDSFCKIVVANQAPLEISDARLDPRVCDSPFTASGVIAYLGYPLENGAGETIGSVCAVDGFPREWTEVDREAIQDLAAAASAEVIRRELRLRLEAAWTMLAAVALVAILILLSSLL